LIYAIGDIHGQLHLLQPLLDHLRSMLITDADELVFIGDYIDRGKDSPGVMDELMRVATEFPRSIFLRGNHEQMMLDSREGPEPRTDLAPGRIGFSNIMLNWLDNGGADTLQAYDIPDYSQWWDYIPGKHWRFIESTLLEYVTEKFHFVHAGLLPPGETWEGEPYGLDARLWIREPFLDTEYVFEGRTVVFGHTPQRTGQPLVHPNKIGIDTAAAYGGPLTVVRLDPTESEEPIFWQVTPAPNSKRQLDPAD